MPEYVVREESETLGLCVQGVLHLHSGRREQEASKARSLTPYLILSVAQGPEVVKLRSLMELCGLRISEEGGSCLKETLLHPFPFPVTEAHVVYARLAETKCGGWHRLIMEH